MTDVVFVFEVHQPYRLRRGFFWENRLFRRVKKEEFFEYYFDDEVNREVFLRACEKCYLPSNRILIDLIDEHKGGKRQVRFSFSISGVFLEQCERFNPDLLDSFRQLAETGCVEFLSQTYYHSLASLYPEKDEFMWQVKKHQETIRDLLGQDPVVFENTELIYNNLIARTIEHLGFRGIITEGAERILHGRSPNHVYAASRCERIRVLLRNYKLTDDVGFRFSARWWREWPLTAEKYASWLASTPGEYICIFPDYETFGEHHWPESGIHEFLKSLPREILRWEHLSMSTPSEVIGKYDPVGEIDVPELGGTVSWADLQRDTSGWLGNTMQWAYYTSVRRLEPFVKELGDEEFLRVWRSFQISDHLYYMCTTGGGPGLVHSYFSPFPTPTDAYVTSQAALLDFENRVRLASVAADEPFLFYTGRGKKHFTGKMAWTLKGFIQALKRASLRSIEFHNRRGDFERWARHSLHDEELAERLSQLRTSGKRTNALRKSLIKASEEIYQARKRQTEEATRYF